MGKALRKQRLRNRLAIVWTRSRNAAGSVVCWFREGHDYPCLFFSADTLCFCRRCGKEVLDRDFEDLEPIDEETWEMIQNMDHAPDGD